MTGYVAPVGPVGRGTAVRAPGPTLSPPCVVPAVPWSGPVQPTPGPPCRGSPPEPNQPMWWASVPCPMRPKIDQLWRPGQLRHPGRRGTWWGREGREGREGLRSSRGVSDLVDRPGCAQDHHGCRHQKSGTNDGEDEMPPAPTELPGHRHCRGRRGRARVVARAGGTGRYRRDDRAGEPVDRPEHPHRPETDDHDDAQGLITDTHAVILPDVGAYRPSGGVRTPSAAGSRPPLVPAGIPIARRITGLGRHPKSSTVTAPPS
jgi:hypothetical protein